MGVLDKFLDAIKLNDDDYDDDEFFDEEDDYEDSYEEKPHHRFFRRSEETEEETVEEPAADVEEEDLEMETAAPVTKHTWRQPKTAKAPKAPKTAAKPTPKAAQPKQPKRPSYASSKITPMRNSKRQGGVSMEVIVVKPKSMEDTREIADALINHCTVVVNLEGIGVDVAQRIIDFASGSCYSLSGGLQQVSSFIFIITPSDVDISGDLQDILNGAFELPSIRSEY